MRANSSSVMSETETRDSMDDLFRRELEKKLHRDIDVEPFLCRFFKLNYNIMLIEKALNQAWDKEGNLKDFPNDGNAEKHFYDPFIAATACILEIYSINKRKFINNAKKAVIGSIGTCLPDTLFLESLKAPTSEDDSANWKDVLAVGEIKNSQAEDKPKTDLQLASYAREVFGSQPHRRFVLGFTLCGAIMRLWLFDRAGGISSKPFDINSQRQWFIRVIVGLGSMDLNSLGFDPTINICSTPREKNSAFAYIDADLDIEGKKVKHRFLLIEAVFARPVVNGRGTVCWKANISGQPKKFYAIKDSWRQPTREPEGEMLLSATRALEGQWEDPSNPHVAKHYAHYDVQSYGQVDNISNVRQGLPVKASENRIHTRTISSTFGKAIYQFEDHRELLQAFRDAIVGYNMLYTKAGIIHGDISLHNIMIGPNGRGFLIDLDYAVFNARTTGAQSPQRTGTLPFMAIGVLRAAAKRNQSGGYTHLYRYDIESFFYVLLWICCYWEGPDKKRSTKCSRPTLKSWSKGTSAEIAAMKYGMMMDFEGFEEAVLSTFSPYFDRVKSFVKKFHEILFPQEVRNVPDTVDYEAIIKLFESELEIQPEDYLEDLADNLKMVEIGERKRRVT